MSGLLWLVGAGLFVMGISMGGSIGLFIDPPSLTVVVGGTALFWMAYHRPSGVVSAVRAALGPGGLSVDENEQHLLVLATGRTLAVGIGVVGMLIGLVNMLANMDNPASIGPAMAFALLSMFYAVLLSEVCIGPLMNRIRTRSGNEGQLKSPAGPSALAILATPCALATFFVMFSSFKDWS